MPDHVSTWIKENWWLLAAAMTLLGIGLRLQQYFANRSLWRDEASLALNIMARSFGELSQPLDDNQGAPLLFLWALKGITLLFGSGEYALRLLPLVCGLLAMVAFWGIAAQLLRPPAIFFAVTLFALSDPLIDYASEVKQYGSDVLVSVIVVAMFLQWRRQAGYLNAVGFGLLGSGLIWFSHPAIFLLAAMGLTLAAEALYQRNVSQIKYLAVLGSLWLISFAGFYLVSITSLTSNDYLIQVWEHGFPPRSLRPDWTLVWLVEALLAMFDYPGGLPVFGLGAILYSVGLLTFYQRDRALTAMLGLPILLTVIAAFAWQYPFAERLILFLVPLLLLPIALGLDELLQLLVASPYRRLAPLVLLLVFFFPIIEGGRYLLEPRYKEEIRPVMEHVAEQWQPGDMIYIYYGAERPFEYYQTQLGLVEKPTILGIEAREQWVNYLPDLNQLGTHERVWLVFSHVHSGHGVNEEQLMVNWLERTGAERQDWFFRAGAAAYLYEMPR